MALSLLKIVGSGTTQAKPTVKNYFHTMSGAVNSVAAFSIAVANFVTDAGTTTTALALASANNGYYTLFINGVVQQTGLIQSVAVGKLKIAVATGTLDLKANEVIALAVTNFAPTTTFQG